MEANGGFSIIKNEHALPGLFVIPRWDEEIYGRLQKSDEMMACENCGLALKKPFDVNSRECPSCGHVKWTLGVY
ncbi:hypothetical protein CKK33_02385 [Mucilaginibacter sp. MD40]|uniref:hypothetical protein n=1 Tax=Mucilaginibacter sp. MD40 TaxID=2029590 RepID=UPI000BAC845D|nr:hypothetical protein [Mucilaginibacter sp. MD40]PAW92402.1 hypothetical protein CKK33_02385 [Mucilaginibacter sp. MD40]